MTEAKYQGKVEKLKSLLDDRATDRLLETQY